MSSIMEKHGPSILGQDIQERRFVLHDPEYGGSYPFRNVGNNLPVTWHSILGV